MGRPAEGKEGHSVPAAPAAARPHRPRAAQAAAMLSLFAVALDVQVVNVALPDIRQDLGGGLSGLQWVVTGYTLMFSALLLFAGTFSDYFGARRAYGVGMSVFTLASVACGAAPTLGVLVAARVLQGVGAALVTPPSLGLIREAFHASAERARAITYWALGGTLAAAAGPLLGGALTELNWRLIFLLNVPVGLLALGVLRYTARSPGRVAAFDWTGQATATIGLAALTYGVIEGGNLGYGSAPILAAFATAAGSLGVFLSVQARGPNPMLPLDLFRSRPVVVALAIAFVGMAGFAGVVFLESLYFQQLRGASPLTTGLLFLPMTALMAVANPFVARLGRFLPIVGGQLVMAAGLVALCLIPPNSPTVLVAALMVPVGVGGSVTVPPIVALILDEVPGHRAGAASGVFNTFRWLGGSLGVAVFGAIVGHQASFLTGLRISLLATAALLTVTATASAASRG